MYSSVGTPVFYIDNFLYLKTIGKESAIWGGEIDSSWIENENVPNHTPSNAMELFALQPTIAKPLDYYEVSLGAYDGRFANIHSPVMNMTDYTLSDTMKGYCAILNSNALFYAISLSGTSIAANEVEDWLISCNFEGVFNFDGSIATANVDEYMSEAFFQDNIGSNIFTFDVMPDADNMQIQLLTNIGLAGFPYVGAISTGIQYTMPRTPELDLQMQIEYDGIDTITTSGGKSLSNIKYTGTPKWTNFIQGQQIQQTPFSNRNWNSPNSVSQRNGRRKWSLSFKHLNNYDLFMSNPANNQNVESLDTSGMQSGDTNIDAGHTEFSYTIDSDDSFIAQVWNKTLGGGLPFMFQPDSNNSDEIYMCKFDQDTLSIKQSAFNVYDISVKITEVW